MGERYQITLGGFAEREVADGSADRSVSLRGVGDLSRSLEVKTDDGDLEALSRLQVSVRTKSQPDDLSALHVSIEAGTMLAVLSCNVSNTLFVELDNPAVTRVAVDFELADTGPLVMSRDFAGFKLANVGFTVVEQRNIKPPPRSWKTKAADVALYALQVDSQLGRIAVELTSGLCAATLANKSNDSDWEPAERLGALFRSLRCAAPLATPELLGSVADVREQLRTMPPVEAGRLAAAYDTIWVSKPSLKAITGRTLDPADTGELTTGEGYYDVVRKSLLGPLIQAL